MGTTTRDELDADDLEWGDESYELVDLTTALSSFREPYELEEAAVHPREEELPLFVPVPKDPRHHGRANINYGKRYVTDYPSYYDDEEEERAPRPSPQLGKVEETSDSFLIQWAVRGQPAPTEAQLTRLVAKYSRKNKSGGRVMTDEFYRDLIFPYVARLPTGTPFEWAFERARLAVGFTATMDLLHQTPLGKLMGPFMALAGKVVNAPSSEESIPKKLVKTPKRVILQTALKSSIAEPSPELLWFVLENEQAFTPELLESRKVQDEFNQLNKCLENGLRINRVNEIFHIHAKTLNPLEALLASLKLVRAIFGKGKAPWWFREDIDFGKLFDPEVEASGVQDGVYKLAPDAAGLELVSTVARNTRYGFEYGIELYKKEGWRFLDTMEGVSPTHLWKTYGVITESYGIGNVPRACNVAQFIREFLGKVPPSVRLKTLEKLEKHAKKAAPTDALVGRLQGEDASLHLPGLSSLLVTQLGEDRMKVDRVDSSTVSVVHLTEMATRLARPVQVRALDLPGAVHRKFLNTVRLLTDHTKPFQLETEAVSTQTEETQLALLGLLEFYEQFEQECRDPKIAQEYFTFYAHRMPDPFHPPAGFLRFLETFETCRDIRWKFPETEAPRDREAIREKNAAVFVERRLVLGNLIDVWTKGLITAERFQEILMSISDTRACNFAAPSVGSEYEREARGMARSEAEDGETYGQQDTINLFARYLCLRDSLEVIALHHKLVEAGIMTPEDLATLTRETALDPLGTRGTKVSKIVRGEKYEELLPCMRAMVASGCVRLEDLRDSLQKGTLLERYIYSSRNTRQWDKRRHTSPDFFTRLEEVWYAAYCFDLMYKEVSKTEYRDEAVREIKRSLDRGYFKEGYMRGEVAEVVEGLISDAVCRLKGKCDELTMHATISIDRDRFIEQYFPLSEVGKMFFAVWYELLHHLNVPDEAVIHLIEQVPHANPMEGKRYSIAEQGTGLETISPLTRFTVGISVLGERKNPDRPASAVGRVTDQVISMVTFALALSEVPSALLGNLSIETGVTSAKREVDDGHVAILRSEMASKALKGGASLSKILTEGADVYRPLIEDVVRLRDKMGELRGVVVENIRKARENAWGLVPVGGKIHVLHPVDSTRFALLKEMLGFDSTQFKLDRASTSIIIPPVPSAEESIAMVNMLAKVGILDDAYPELQITLPGRLPPEEVAILGSFVLLATERGIAYDMQAFSTTHDSQTGARIMAYDAGHTPLDMPFMPPLKGRTDMLGRRHAGDIKIMQRVGTVLLQAHAKKGPFARFAAEFKERYRAILAKHGIEEVLKGNWIYLPSESQRDEEASIRHYQTVKACTDAYFACAQDYRETGSDEGIIFEVRELLEWLEGETAKEQRRLRESGETCAEEAILLSL